jgi:PAS domain S-box-containing protein
MSDSVPAHRVLEVLTALSYRSSDLNAYLQGVVTGISQLLRLDWSVVTLCRGKEERLLASSLDLGAALHEVYQLHGTLTQTVVTQGCPLRVQDTTLESEYGSGVEGYRAYLGVPLKLPTGDILGTICSFHTQPRRFTDEEVQLAELFAERAAIAIDNFQLFERQQLLNQALQTEIAERKATELALRSSQHRFRALVEQATDAFYIVGPDTRILDVNPQACLGLGYTRTELLQMKVTDIQVVQDRQVIQKVLQTLEPGKPKMLEGSHRCKNGRTFPVEVSISQIELDHEPVYLALARDISDRKQAQAARERLAEIGELASMVVHEVRNPLTTIWMALTAMQREPLSDRGQTRLQFAVEEASRLQGLLSDILLYAKPTQQLARQDIDLNTFLANLIETLATQPAIATHPIHWTPCSEAANIVADADKLKQVFINLMTNACEASPVGDPVICWVEKVQGKAVHIHVQNGGDPIPPAILPQLTKPFFTTKSTGNGLGLAITQRIVEAHGGHLAIHSTAQEGTRVSIQFPAAV